MTAPRPPRDPPEILVRFHTLAKDAPPDQLLDTWRFGLGDEFGDLTVLSRVVHTIQDRPGGRLDVALTQTGRPVVSFLSAIRARPRGYFSIVYTGPADDKLRGDALYERVLSSFRLLEDERTDQVIVDAIARGKRWLRDSRRIDLLSKIQPPLCLRITEDGRDKGFVLVTEELFELRGTEGVRVIEEGWTFDGEAVQYLHDNLFLSADHDVEAWEHRVLALVPAREKAPQTLALAHEEGLRDGDALLTAQSYQFGKRPDNNEHLRLPEGYISRLLLRWLPRLVDLAEPALFAFSYFDHQRGALVLRTVEIKGRGDQPHAGRGGPAFLVVVREGLSGPASELHFDASGRLLRMTAGTLVMQPANADALERKWSTERTRARRYMAELESEYQRTMSRFGARP
ncbi:MAG: hypothetical protein V3T70_11070, partial [Phycisphaerae bacterium]